LQSASDKFKLKLKYNEDNDGLSQWNGNIARQYWGGAGEDVNNLSKRYDYSYDKLNRLTSGVATNGQYEQGIGYDKNGNITGLVRNLPQEGVNNVTYGYHYENNGTSNRLQNVDNMTGTYGYDGNGNVSYDARNGVNIGYNFLNLPQLVSQNGNTLSTYIYDALGRKLRKVLNGTATDYIAGIQYTNGSMEFIQTEEGRAIKSGGNWNYEYTLTDHLGNNRLAFDTRNNTANKVQEDDYLPFGMKVAGSVVSSPENKYLYNKKELQDELGQYDYGARFYDPVIARWGSVDPLAEKGRRWSPYGYAFNDPMRFVDPDGMWPWPSMLDLKRAYNSTVSSVSKSYDQVVASTKSAYHQTTSAVSQAGVTTQKWTTEHKAALLDVAKNMQEVGDKTAVVGAGMAIAGAPVAGVGAAPGLAVAGAGGIVSTAGTVLEVTVDLVTGNNKDAAITTGNEVMYRGLEKLGSKAIDDALPGTSATVKVVAEQANKLIQTAVKTQTDKVVDKYKDKDK